MRSQQRETGGWSVWRRAERKKERAEPDRSQFSMMMLALETGGRRVGKLWVRVSSLTRHRLTCWWGKPTPNRLTPTLAYTHTHRHTPRRTVHQIPISYPFRDENQSRTPVQRAVQQMSKTKQKFTWREWSLNLIYFLKLEPLEPS